MTPEHCRRTADRKDCVNGEISGMVVTRRVPSPRSVRHLLQVASVSASVVGKRVLHVKHGRSASSRASLRGESLLRVERSNSVASELSWGVAIFHSCATRGGAPSPNP